MDEEPNIQGKFEREAGRPALHGIHRKLYLLPASELIGGHLKFAAVYFAKT